MELRPYQAAAIDSLYRWWQSRSGYPLIELPTGAGKTVVFCELIKRLFSDCPDLMVLVLAHRKELLTQAAQKMIAVWPEAPIGTFCAGLNARQIAPITIASRGTLANCVDAFPRIDLVVVDECHNVSPDDETQYRGIINRLKTKNPSLMVIGFTATPYRRKQGKIYGSGDQHLFAGIAYRAPIRELIDQGYLCPVVSPRLSSDHSLDTSSIKITAGDYNVGQMEKVALQEDLIRQALDDWQQHAKDRQATVFFCVSIAHAEAVSDALRERGIIAPVIHGNTSRTPSFVRERHLKDFDEGRLNHLCNVGVLTEGWDCPRLDCIVLLRATRSVGLYLQIVGRGLRKHPNKTNTLVLDFGGNIDRFGPIDEAKPVTRRKKIDRTKDCPKCGTILGVLARTCPNCFEVFQLPPMKTCKKCQAKVPTSTTACPECNEIFVNHEAKASGADILNTPKTYDGTGIDFYVRTSNAKGLTYLVIAMICGIETYEKFLFLGYPGFAGKRSRQEWKQLAKPSTRVPDTPEQAMQLGPDVLRPIKQIKVERKEKYRYVSQIIFG